MRHKRNTIKTAEFTFCWRCTRGLIDFAMRRCLAIVYNFRASENPLPLSMNSCIHSGKREKGVSMKKSIGLSLIVLVCCILIVPVSAQDLGISTPPLEWMWIPGHPIPPVAATYDYGDVVLGESKTTTFTLNSPGSSDVSVYLLCLSTSAEPLHTPESCIPYCGSNPCTYCLESYCFNQDTVPSLPDVIPPGEYRLVDVTFTPSDPGEKIVYLYIRSNDTYPPPGSVAYIRLEGTGVSGPNSAPEFPTMFLPATIIIGFLGAVLLIRRTREQ